MASFSLPSAQAGHDNQPGKMKMKMEEEEEQEQDGQSEASVDGPKPFLVKLRWNRHEDAMLIKHISSHGGKHWKLISDQLPGRSPASCRMRWWGQLCPKLLKIYNEMKQKYQATAAVPPPTPIFTIHTRVSYENYLKRIMYRFSYRVRLATSYIQQQETTSYQPQPWSPSPPPPPPPSPSSPPTFIDFLGMGSV